MKRLIVGLGFFFAACGPYVPPPIPQPPAPTIREVQLTVWTPVDPTATLTIDGTSTHAAWTADCSSTRLDDKGVKVICRLPVDAPAPFGTHLRIWADGFDPVPIDFATIDFSLNVPVSVQEIAGVELRPSFTPLPRLVVAGQFFRKDNGERFTAIEASDFNLFNRFLMGENIDPVLDQRSSVGFNMLRVWTAFNVCPPGAGCQEIGRLVPAEHGDYDAQLRLFLRAAAKRGVYVELTAFTGPYDSLFGNGDQMVAHWARLVQAAAEETNVILELVNEFDQAANAGIPIERLQQPPPPVLASHGSNGSQAQPVPPFWAFVTFHTNSAPEAPRKVGHNCYEIWAGPCLANENTRSPDNFSSNDEAFDSAAGAALLAAGSCFHSVRGKNSTLWDGIELDNARAWVGGARSVPLQCQDGPYVHRDDLEGAAYLRVYQRGGSDACIVRIRP